jgi:antitoxin HicB
MNKEEKMKRLKYSAIIRPLSKEEGGGYLIEIPELPGCMADGETVEEAFIPASS